MYKVVNELVYFPHDVFVSGTTTLSSSFKLLYHQLFLHFYLKLVLPGTTYQTILLMLIATLSVLKSFLSNYMYHVNSQ